MKDLIKLAMYSGGSFIIIVALFKLYDSGVVSGSTLGMLAILVVIILPIVFSVVFVNREKKRELGKSKN